MVNMKQIVFYIFLLIISLSCSNWDARLVLVNKTNYQIYYSVEPKNKNDFQLDTNYCNEGGFYNIKPNSEINYSSQINWDLYFKQQPNDVLRIYLFNEDTLSKYGKCKVLKERMIMKQYDLTFEDLEKMNWHILYDGKN